MNDKEHAIANCRMCVEKDEKETFELKYKQNVTVVSHENTIFILEERERERIFSFFAISFLLQTL